MISFKTKSGQMIISDGKDDVKCQPKKKKATKLSDKVAPESISTSEPIKMTKNRGFKKAKKERFMEILETKLDSPVKKAKVKTLKPNMFEVSEIQSKSDDKSKKLKVKVQIKKQGKIESTNVKSSPQTNKKRKPTQKKSDSDVSEIFLEPVTSEESVKLKKRGIKRQAEGKFNIINIQEDSTKKLKLKEKTSVKNPKIAKSPKSKKVDTAPVLKVKKEKKVNSKKVKSIKPDETDEEPEVESIKKRKRKLRANQRGVVYFSHIPHGFYEEQIKTYCAQFGEVTGVYLPKSKIGNYRGYGFVEFKYPEVAEIVADTMHNYLMFNRLIKAKYIPPELQKPWAFKRPVRSSAEINAKKREGVLNRTKTLTPEQEEKRKKKVENNAKSYKEKLQKLGLSYNFEITNQSDFVTDLYK